MSALVISVAVVLFLLACAAVLMAFLLPGASGAAGPQGPQGPPGADVKGVFPAFPIVAAGTATIGAVNTLYYYGSDSAVRAVAVSAIAADGVLVIANSTGAALSCTFADGRVLSLPDKNCFYVSVYGAGQIYVQQTLFAS